METVLREAIINTDIGRSSIEIKAGALRWLDDRLEKLPRETCRVHAEAGLLALASDVHHLRVDHGARITHAFMHLDGVLPVGVARKCCWTCFRLAALMFSGGQSLQPTLPDTHATILPWDPPCFGIPKEVLAKLRDELKFEAVRKAIEVSRYIIDASRQSSGAYFKFQRRDGRGRQRSY